jgi:lysophospholipase L1-like esterase
MENEAKMMKLICAAALMALAARAADPHAPIKVGDYTPPIRVACLGDSITHGVGANAGWSWPEQLDRMLGKAWDVRNFGHSGAAVCKEEKHTIWNQKEYKNALLLHPDVVLILLGTNDSKPPNWAHKQDFLKLYRELVASFQGLSSKPRVFCCTPPYVAKRGNFGINEAGVLEQIPMIQEVAKQLDAGVIDVHGALAGKDECYKDNVHPLTPGATVIATTIYQVLTGKTWEGEIPAPVAAAQKSQPAIRVVENPGVLTYRETYALIAAEAGLPPDKLEPIREKYEETEHAHEARLVELEDQIREFDQLRMKYKHTQIEAEKPLYGEYKGKGAATRKELEKYKADANQSLVALLPVEGRAGFGAAWLARFMYDRLAPIAGTFTGEQRKKIRELCREQGAAFAAINNTPERVMATDAAFKAVYEEILNAAQQKRIEPQ